MSSITELLDCLPRRKKEKTINREFNMLLKDFILNKKNFKKIFLFIEKY
jgi:hypothetical protein